MTRKLEIDWGELEIAFQNSSWEMRYYPIYITPNH